MLSKINVAHDFSRYPAGRYKDDGPYNGEKFRDEILIPILKESQHVTIELDGVRGYGSSFLEEAFGGLIRKGISSSEVLNKIEFISTDTSLIEEIKEYITNAGAR